MSDRKLSKAEVDAVFEAAKTLRDVIERYRPLDGPWPASAYRDIEDAQDKLIAALGEPEAWPKTE